MAFALPTRPTATEMQALAETWRPWRAVAARILWAYYRVAAAQRRRPAPSRRARRRASLHDQNAARLLVEIVEKFVAAGRQRPGVDPLPDGLRLYPAEVRRGNLFPQFSFPLSRNSRFPLSKGLELLKSRHSIVIQASQLWAPSVISHR